MNDAGLNKPASGSDVSSLQELRRSIIYTVVTVLFLGLLYPALMTVLCNLAFPHQAQGSLVVDGRGTIVGSDLTGQTFASPRYFHGRPSAAGKGYDPTSSGGTNLGPTSKKLMDATRDAITALRHDNPDATGPIPTDLVTSSASGLDPDITPEAASFQAARVAKARGLSLATVRNLVAASIQGPQLGLFGEAHVNVLDLNRALDAQGAMHS